MVVDGKFFTKTVQESLDVEPTTGAIITPIFQTSTYVQEEPGKHLGYDYSRAGNPSRDKVEKAIARLEGSDYGLVFSSGLAAEQAIIQLLNPGDHVLVCDDVYGGTGRLFRTLFAKYDIHFHFVCMTDVDSVKELADKVKPKLLWMETPTNPTLKIIDIEAMAGVIHSHSGILVVDNTFASPLFQSPFKFGADVIVHSTTKYIGGHTDLIGGALICQTAELFEKLRYVQFATGPVPSPFECFLLSRSLKTLAVRMAQHEANAQKVAAYLVEHPKVKKTLYPGLPEHPGNNIAVKQMQGYSGMVSFEWGGDYSSVVACLKRLKIFRLAESLGGVESLVNHPERMTHASVPEALRKQLGITEGLIRLSVGIESADDLIADLDYAFT